MKDEHQLMKNHAIWIDIHDYHLNRILIQDILDGKHKSITILSCLNSRNNIKMIAFNDIAILFSHSCVRTSAINLLLNIIVDKLELVVISIL